MGLREQEAISTRPPRAQGNTELVANQIASLVH